MLPNMQIAHPNERRNNQQNRSSSDLQEADSTVVIYHLQMHFVE